ncbi:CinA family protein [Microbacterium sp. NPDC056569]|uniref:CinA family protein n=1 Tax=Microbacterium sp. NPDC056569 TaxID=3345867 RepID=UPI00366CFD9D
MTTSLERAARLAQEHGLKIGVAESLTSGLLAATVGKGENAKDWFCGGIVAYRMEVKADLLGVPVDQDPCSPECARQLARGARELLGTDITVSTTGVGGPDPEDGHEPGTVHLGWATADADGSHLLNLDGGPEEVLRQAVDASLTLLAEIVDGMANAEA